MKISTRAAAIFALCLAGLGWGTTGLFVRSIGNLGLTVYELMIVRLLVAGAVLAPVLIFSLARSPRKIQWRSTFNIGLAMVFYYLGAITAFHNLQLVVAALIIGSSPLVAWLAPFVIERRLPTSKDFRQGSGVAIAIFGLGLLVLERAVHMPSQTPREVQPLLGLFGAILASLITVFNARTLKRLGNAAPKPLDITLATVFLGLVLTPLILEDLDAEFYKVFWIARDHIWLCLGFGTLATAIPGLAITYASVRLEPQATATVSIQLQVWSGVLAWILLGEAMSALQVFASLLVLTGSYVCLRNTYPETT